MTSQQIGSTVDWLIPLGVGFYLLLARHKITARVRDESKRQRTDRVLKIATLLLLASSVLIGAASLLREKDVLGDAVKKINVTAPKMIDAVTVLEGASAGPGQRLTCNITLTTMTLSSIDRQVWQNDVVPKIRAALGPSPGVTAALTEGITVVYRYAGSDGVLIDEIIFTPVAKP